MAEEPQIIITHGMPLEILAVTFHTLVGEVTNQTVMAALAC